MPQLNPGIKSMFIRIFFLLILAIGLISVVFVVQQPQELREKAQTLPFDPKTVPITEHGPIMIHGQTYTDRWGAEINHPPLDGTINSWSFYGNGDELVTKENTFWRKTKGQTSWTVGDLKQKWAACSNFPSTGIDAYAIHPVSGEEQAFKGYLLFRLSNANSCLTNGVDWRSDWSSRASPNGRYPFDQHNHLDAFQYLDANNQIVITNNEVWLIGENVSTHLCQNPQPSPWQFCNPETLYNRWVVREQTENHPPTNTTGIHTVAYNPYYQIHTYDTYIWERGKNNQWSTFVSGSDGYGMREAFWLKDNNQYYLYYDALNAFQPWQTAVAVSNTPLGPWRKLGIVSYTGAIRSWEAETSTAPTVYKIGSTYYNIYLGAPRYFGTDTFAQRYRVPGFDSGYYRTGLATSTSPLGPFNRLRGDGTTNPATTTDPPYINSTSGWHTGNYPSAQGTLLQFGSTYWYTYTSQGPLGFGIGKATTNNILGPWIDDPNFLISHQAQSENAGVFFHETTGLYFMFTNGVTKPPHDTTDRWARYWQGCGVPTSGLTTEGAALVMYWTTDPNNWDWQNNYRVIASSQGTNYVNNGIETTTTRLGCGGDHNYIPGAQLRHRGNVGLGFPLFVPEENKLYVAFDGGDFGGESANKLKNHMFRDIYLLSFSLPAPQASPTPSPTPTLSASLIAIPTTGQAPLNNVDLRAGLSGTATGTIRYRFDCDNNGTFEHDVTNTVDPYTAVDLCSYSTSGAKTAAVRVDRQGLSATATTTITVTAAPTPTPTPQPTPSPSATPTPRPTPTPSPPPTPSPSPTLLPTPTASPSYTVSQLKSLLQDYLSNLDSNYRPIDTLVNMLDAGWIIRWLQL